MYSFIITCTLSFFCVPPTGDCCDCFFVCFGFATLKMGLIPSPMSEIEKHSLVPIVLGIFLVLYMRNSAYIVLDYDEEILTWLNKIYTLSCDGVLFCWKSRSFSKDHPETVVSQEGKYTVTVT